MALIGRIASRVIVPLANRASSTSSVFLHRRYYSDDRLLRLIDSEIQFALESREEGEKVPRGFPFKIQNRHGQKMIRLRRTYECESISVEVDMPNRISGEEKEDEVDERGYKNSLPLVVSVSNKSGHCLEFHCTAYPLKLAIHSLSVKDPAHQLQTTYHFSNLNEKLHKAFNMYLWIRGITSSTTNYLYEYMIDKDSKEYIKWLNNLHKFVRHL